MQVVMQVGGGSAVEEENGPGDSIPDGPRS